MWRLGKNEFHIMINCNQGILFPLFLYLIVITLSVLAIGPQPNLLSEIGPAIIWTSALLSLLLASSRLFIQEHDYGIFEQLQFGNHSLSLFIMIKVVIFWIITVLPIIIATPILGQLLYMDAIALKATMLTLLVGTPSLCILSAIGSVLTLSVNKRSLLLLIVIVPFYIPILIFAVLAIEAARSLQPINAYLALLGAIGILLSVASPFVLSATIKLNR